MEFQQLALSLIVILVVAKLGSELAEHFRQSPVLGELLGGILLVNLFPAFLGHEKEMLLLLAEVGAVLLLFEIGLESELDELKKVGVTALLVATVGVVCPLGLGYLAGHFSRLPFEQSLYIGATLTATSVGITARVFQDLKRINSPEAKIILGAAVADDVMGLVVLSVVLGIVEGGTFSWLNVFRVIMFSIAFLTLAIVLGKRLAPALLRVANQMRSRGMLVVSAFVFCLILAYSSELVGLAAIVGAFAAGIVLADTEHRLHLQDRFKPLADIFIPIFFVMMGAEVKLLTFNPMNPENHQVLMVAGLLILVAIIGKIVSGVAVKRGVANKLVVGVGMIPRGEVGLIFVSVGLSHKILTEAYASALILTVFISTLVTPPLLKILIERLPAAETAPAGQETDLGIPGVHFEEPEPEISDQEK